MQAMNMEESRQFESLLKDNLVQAFDDIKKNDKDAFSVVMYALYPDMVEVYKHIKATSLFGNIDKSKLDQLTGMYNDIKNNGNKYQGAQNTLEGLNEKLSQLGGLSIADPEAFESLGNSLSGLGYKMGKDLEKALADLKQKASKAFGIDENTANTMLSDKNNRNALTLAVQSYKRAKSMGGDVILQFCKMVSEVLNDKNAANDFNYAYDKLDGILQSANPEKKPGDTTTYSPEFVKAYVEQYNSMYGPFEDKTYNSIEEAVNAFKEFISKGDYGSAMTIAVNLINAGVDIQQELPQVSQTLDQIAQRSGLVDGFQAIGKHFSIGTVENLVELGNKGGNPNTFYDLNKLLDSYEEDVKDCENIKKFVKSINSPKLLYVLVSKGNSVVPKYISPESGVQDVHSSLLKLAILSSSIWKFKTIGKMLENAVEQEFNKELYADKSDEECKQYYTNNYDKVLSRYEVIKRILSRANKLGMISNDSYNKFKQFLDVKMPPLLKEGEKALLERLEKMEMPKDNYKGADILKIKKIVAEDEEKKHPEEKVLGIIITSPDWEIVEVKKYEFEDDAIVEKKINYRKLGAYMIEERGRPFYYAYPILIHSSPYENGWGDPYVGGPSLSKEILFLPKDKVKEAGLLLEK